MRCAACSSLSRISKFAPRLTEWSRCETFIRARWWDLRPELPAPSLLSKSKISTVCGLWFPFQKHIQPASARASRPRSVCRHIQDLSRFALLRLVVPVPEAYTAGIREGQQAAFSVPAYPGRTFHAPIARIAHDVTQNTRTMAVELDVRNTDGQITPGSFATVEWPIQRSYPTMLIPSTSVTTDLQRTFVIRVRQGKAEWVDVKTGVTVNGKTEVFGELQPGDIVVANATDAIRPGTSLSTRQLSSPAPGT